MSTESVKHPRVGVGVFVFRNGKFLIQQRRGAHGDGTWSLPGGHLEYGESFEQTARREVAEETGMLIKNVSVAAVTNDIFMDEKKHYVTIWTICDWAGNDPKINEPDKCSAQQWVVFDNLPEPLFLPWKQLRKHAAFADIVQALAQTKL